VQLAIALDVIEKRFEMMQAEFNSALQNIQASRAEFEVDDYVTALKESKGFV
jgi:hypothetical protein